MNQSIALAEIASRLAALLAGFLKSHPSKMLIAVLTRALPSGRLGRDHRPTCSCEGSSSFQYFGTDESTSVDQASMPPSTFETSVNPCPNQCSAAAWLRPPW